MTFGQRVYDFYINHELPQNLPAGIEVMNPYSAHDIQERVKTFMEKFFADNNKRVFVFGINPGRFGAGITGITFTDPVALKEHCGIDNSLQQKKELSSDFIYQFINAYGGAKKFYASYFLTAISPLGYVKKGINYNYYDDKELLEATLPYIINSTSKQIQMGANRKNVIVLGSGKNLKIFEKLNKEHGFFNRIIPLDHPRFIMQYRRKYIDDYIKKYLERFEEARY